MPSELAPGFMLIAVIIPLVVAPLVTHLLVGVVFELESTRVALTKLSRTDDMTDLSSRRFFLERLRIDKDRARALALPLSLCIVDVDHFKAINDQYGHPSGDNVLKAVGAALSEAVRSTDLPARFGGDEFVILLPDTHLNMACEVAGRVVALIAARKIQGDTASPISCTVSVGVATLLPSDLDESAVINRGDAALYRAKTAGRNRWSS